MHCCPLQSPHCTWTQPPKSKDIFFGIQVTTDHGTFSGGLTETLLGGDAATRVDATKDFLSELAQVISVDESKKDETQYQLLFNIKNTMTDRGPTSKGWVEGLQLWREDILEQKLLPQYVSRSNTFYTLNEMNAF